MDRDPPPLFEIHVIRIAEDEKGEPYVDLRVGPDGPQRRLYVTEILKLYFQPPRVS